MDQVLKTRAITAVIFGIIVIAMMLTGEWGVSALLAIVAIGGSYEYNKIAGKNNGSKYASMIIALIIFLIAYFVEVPSYIKDVLLGLTICFYLFFITNVLSDFRLDHNTLLPFFSLIYPCLALALPLFYKNDEIWANKFWFYSVLLIWISDTGAYLVGRKLGKTKLLEKVSPKKTIEGSIGAGIFTVLGGILIFYFTGSYSLLFWVIASITIWIIGTFGDLYESTIKRKYDVKDSGSIMPGHGGFLDRFDSLIFAAPFLVLLLKIFN